MPELSAAKARKAIYREKLQALLREYKSVLICNVDNVGSNQMQQVRIALRGQAVVLMGKNTVIRKVIRDELAQNPKLESLLPHIRGNVGFVFTNGDLKDMRDAIVSNQVPAAARSGTIAPVDVFIPPGPTPMDPGQTAFFQALNINTKITRGAIEILAEVHLVKKDERVTASAVSLLTKLGIKPFFFGIKVTHVYEDGSLYDSAILDITDDDLFMRFMNGVRTIAALSFGLNFPTTAMVPHCLATAFRKICAISLATEYKIAELEAIASAGPVAGDSGDAAPAEEKKAEAAAPESDSDEDEEGMDFDLFG